jgi:hypothetical protein
MSKRLLGYMVSIGSYFMFSNFYRLDLHWQVYHETYAKTKLNIGLPLI